MTQTKKWTQNLQIYFGSLSKYSKKWSFEIDYLFQNFQRRRKWFGIQHAQLTRMAPLFQQEHVFILVLGHKKWLRQVLFFFFFPHVFHHAVYTCWFSATLWDFWSNFVRFQQAGLVFRKQLCENLNGFKANFVKKKIWLHN